MFQSAYTNDEPSKEVVFRRPKVNGWNPGRRKDDVGRPLKAALEKLCRNATSTSASASTTTHRLNGNNLNHIFDDDSSAALDYYIGEVFRQLDYDQSGFVLREDFELLCDVLGLASSSSSPTSTGFRNSGIEWLTSYMPRPNSPVIITMGSNS